MTVSIHVFTLGFIALAAALGSGCASKPQPRLAPPEITASCFDATAARDTVHVLYGTPVAGDKRVDLFYRSWNLPNEKWSDVISIPTIHAPPGNHHRGNDPQVAVHGDHAVAIWTAQGKGPFGSGPIGVALSSDGGKTWKPGPSPSPPGDSAGYRFPAAAASADAFHVVWIHAAGEERSLRYSRLDFGSGEWSVPTIIDPQCCACCWNELQVDSTGKLYALYRDESPRDMALAVLPAAPGAEWKRIGAVGAFNWKFDGCPHVGGGLALAPEAGEPRLLASVWSGSDRWLGAYVLDSASGGQTWSKPTKLRAGAESGRHTDVAFLSPTEAAVAWDELSEDERIVHVAFTSDGGATWGAAQRLSPLGTQAEYPRLLACDNRFIMLWSEEEANGAGKLRIQAMTSNGNALFRIAAGENPKQGNVSKPVHKEHIHH